MPKGDEDEFSRVLLGTYFVLLVRLSKGDFVTTVVLMEHDPGHLNTVSRRVSKLVSFGQLDRHKAINDNKRYEIAFKVPDALVERFVHARFPIMLRIVLPSLSNTLISLFKDTSLASVIAVPELTYGANWIKTNTFRAVEVWIVVAPIYLAVGTAILVMLRAIERRLMRSMAP